jgi:hypothetical protein
MLEVAEKVRRLEAEKEQLETDTSALKQQAGSWRAQGHGALPAESGRPRAGDACSSTISGKGAQGCSAM